MPSTRPYHRLLTGQLRSIVEQNLHDGAVLHDVFVELTFRRRREALELYSFLGEHLERLADEYFRFPTTDARDANAPLDDEHFQFEQGVLGYHGYRVGVTGLQADQRRGVLDAVYANVIRPLNSAEYMAEWGKPHSGARLRKMAESIAAFTRNAKRSSRKRYAMAIADWESDLEYLRREYYAGRYDFYWPPTE